MLISNLLNGFLKLKRPTWLEFICCTFGIFLPSIKRSKMSIDDFFNIFYFNCNTLYYKNLLIKYKKDMVRIYSLCAFFIEKYIIQIFQYRRKSILKYKNLKGCGLNREHKKNCNLNLRIFYRKIYNPDFSV